MVAIIPDMPKQIFEQPHNHQHGETQQAALARVPWWRKLIPSYALALLIVVLATSITLIGEKFVNVYYFPNSATLLMGILCIALIWGIGPGLFAIILSCCVLFYIDLFPDGNVISGHPQLNWMILVPVAFFALASVIVVILIGQRETARRKALRAEKTAQKHASDLADVNQELLKANQVKDLFVSITSHELKTPITTIRGQAQLALRRLKKQAVVSPELNGLREAFATVDEQTGRLNNLLNELLDLTSLRSGKWALANKASDLGNICRKVVEEQCMVSERTIDLELPSEPIVLYADAARLGQVMTNLVSNALKYSPPESKVEVKAERRDHWARIQVQDAGRGISPEQQENIFQPFYRTSDARASNVSGTGLGLAICKDIVDQHQGRIWYESTLGKGSTFFVDLPIAPTDTVPE